jgi:hypothetical protein
MPLVLFSFALLATDSADFCGSLKQRAKKYDKIRYQIHLPAIFLFTEVMECKLSTEKLISYLINKRLCKIKKENYSLSISTCSTGNEQNVGTTKKVDLKSKQKILIAPRFH